MSSWEEVKTLSASKQRRSLGEASKKEQKLKSQAKPSRTTVLNPKEIEWPEVTDDKELETLLELIKKDMGILKPPVRSVPRKEICILDKGNKQGKRLFRRQWIAQECEKLGFSMADYISIRSSLAIGVNCVSKSLETKQLGAVLIEKDVNPPILTKMLIPLAESNEVPILALTGLNSVFNSATGMRCIALGLKKSCSEPSHQFYQLLKSIIEKTGGDSGDLSQSTAEPMEGPELDTTVSSTESDKLAEESRKRSCETLVIESSSSSGAERNMSNKFKPPKIRKI